MQKPANTLKVGDRIVDDTNVVREVREVSAYKNGTVEVIVYITVGGVLVGQGIRVFAATELVEVQG